MPSSEARTIGGRAEAAARRKYGLETDNQGHDLRNPDNGFVYQVKATRTRNNQGAPGRFRFWKTNHDDLMAGPPGAYILAVYNPETGNFWKIEKVSKSRIDDLIAGRWYASGHQGMDDGRQYKLKWTDVFDR